MAINFNSRYSRGTLDLWNHPDKGEQLSLAPYVVGDMGEEDYVTHIVVEGETFESLAYENYGTSERWWVIAQANRDNDDLFFPLDLTAGMRIRIPMPQVANRV